MERPAARRLDAVLVAASIAGIAFLFAQILTYGHGRDQGIYAVVGRTLLEGGAPYRDAWDFKPPGIFAVYALARALFGSAEVGIRVLECAGLAAMVLAMARLAERWWGEWRIGVLAGAFAVLVHAQLDFWHTAQPESFGGMLTMLALWAGSRPEGEEPAKTSKMLGVAGALFGLAGLLKPPLAGGGAVLAIALAAPALREKRWRDAMRPAGLIALGGASPFLVCLLWFAAKGALGDLWRTLFVFTPKYTALSWEGESLAGMFYWGFTEWLVQYSSVLTVGVLLFPFVRAAREAPGVGLLGGVIAMHIVGVTMQGKFFPYHWGATWPPTAMLAALAYWGAWQRARLHVAGAALFFAAFAGVALCRTACKDVPFSYLERTGMRTRMLLARRLDPNVRDALASVADVNAAANRRVAELLRERVAQGRPVFVWGFEPVIYDLADRPPASRFIYDVPQRVAWAKEGARTVLMADLAERPPAAIVVEHRDVFPMVTGDAIDSADTLRDFPALAEILASRYALAATIEDFDVYLEN